MTDPPAYRGFGRDTWRDPFPLYRRLPDEDPVHRSPLGAWVLTRFGTVFEAAGTRPPSRRPRGLCRVVLEEELGFWEQKVRL